MDGIAHFLQFTLPRDWVWGYFLNGFCVHLIRPLVLAAVVGVIFLKVGRGLGLPLLFRTESRTRQFGIGLGVGVLLWQVVLAGYLFEPFASNFTVDRPPFCERKPVSTASFWNYHSPKYDIPAGTSAEQVRYWCEPADAVSILMYAGSMLAGGVVFAVGVGVLFTLARGGIRVWDAVFGLRPRNIPREPAAPTPLGVVLAVGTVAGFAAMVGVAWFCLPSNFDRYKANAESAPLLYRTGECLVDFAGWGNGAARSEVWAKVTTKTAAELEATRVKTVDDSREQTKLYYPVFGLFFLTFAAVVVINVVFLVLPGLYQYIGPAAGILLLLHLLLGVLTFFDYFTPIPLLVKVLAVGAVVLSARHYKQWFRNIPQARGVAAAEGDTPADRRLRPLQAAYTAAPEPVTLKDGTRYPLLHTADIQFRQGNQPKKPLVLVCVSGGGSRAAAWTVRVLTELEKRFEKEGVAFPYHIRLVTGASGGMFGAAYYVASLPPPEHKGGTAFVPRPDDDPKTRPGWQQPLSHEWLFRSVCGDFLTPVVRSMLAFDLPRMFLPGFAADVLRSGGGKGAGFDRGNAIEHAWKAHLFGHLEQSFAHLREGERQGWRPSLAFSPMLVEDGRQLVISNLDLRDAIDNHGPNLGGRDPLLSREGVEFFKLFPDAQQFAVATAARMSASFPFVFPATTLPTDPRRRVVDAGYYDNYGISLAASWLFTTVGSVWFRDNVSKVAVVQIRDGLSEADRRMERPFDGPAGLLGLATEYLSGPPVGLWNARVASNTFRHDTLLHLLALFCERHGADFTTTAFEFPGSGVSLSFCLTEQERLDIRQGIDGDVSARMDALVKWWFAPPNSHPTAEPVGSSE